MSPIPGSTRGHRTSAPDEILKRSAIFDRWFALAIVLALLGGVAAGLQGWELPRPLRIGWLAVCVAAALLAACYSAWRKRWRRYDPGWLVELARRQHPDEPWLAEALGRCVRASHEGAYLRFVSSRRANKRGSAWQFAENVLLEHETEGELVLDVLVGGRIGGVEFLSRLL